MAHKIDAAECTACGACEAECPNRAIRAKGDAYWINPDKCTDCVGKFDSPQCVGVCPADCISPA